MTYMGTLIVIAVSVSDTEVTRKARPVRLAAKRGGAQVRAEFAAGEFGHSGISKCRSYAPPLSPPPYRFGLASSAS
jgi:hypothetical protein